MTSANVALATVERDLGSEISRAQSLDAVLSVCLDVAIRASDLDCGAVYVFDESDGALVLKVHQGLSASFVELTKRCEADSDRTQMVLRGVPFYGTYSSASFSLDERRQLEGIQAFVVLPVVFHDRVIASMNLGSHAHSGIPSEAREVVEHLAGYIAPFIAQARDEQALRQAHAELMDLFDASADMIFVLDEQGCIVHCSAAVTKRLGHARSELIGRPASAVHPTERREEVSALIVSMLEGRIDVCNIPLVTASGELVEAETRVARSVYRGKPVLLATSRDLTELRAAQAATLELERREFLAQKQQSLGTMAAAVAHNFNNSMTAVLGNLELAQADIVPKTRAALRIHEAMKAARRAAEMSGAMLVYLGKDIKTKHMCDLSEEVRRSLPLLEAFVPQQVRFHTVLAAGLPFVWADTLALRQVLMNLVANAWESLGPPGGDVRVTTCEVHRDGASRGNFDGTEAVAAGRYVALVVEDNGAGMSREIIGQIFDPFFSTKFTGRGLGLPTASGIAKSHGGALEVESEPGVGTSVRLLLPV